MVWTETGRVPFAVNVNRACQYVLNDTVRGKYRLVHHTFRCDKEVRILRDGLNLSELKYEKVELGPIAIKRSVNIAVRR